MIVIALSDLHSQLGALPRLRRVQARYPDATTVLIGDFIDCFGENNSGLTLLEDIRLMQSADPQHVKVLMGNHEAGALNFFANFNSDDWLDYGGLSTLLAEAKRLNLVPNGTSQIAQERLALTTRKSLLTHKSALISWVAALPLTLTIGKLAFVHAGLNLTLASPLTDTSDYNRLWLRNSYFYTPNSWDIFAHNLSGYTLVSGHTPTGKVRGRYENDVMPAKSVSPSNSIYAIQYPGEPPRYLIDGGAGDHNPHQLGNIGVFDSDTGLLIDAVED
jgi:serine/threonine protein phosphatase 1